MRRFWIVALATTSLTAIWLVSVIFVLRPAQARSAEAPSASAPFIWPLSGSTASDANSISSPFGPRWQASQNRYDYHYGLDIAAPQGTPVHVVTDGIVSQIGFLSADSGWTVIISHPQISLYSAYLHVSSAIPVAVNQVVTQGQVIAFVDNTGTTEFYHLHFEFRTSDHGYPTNTRNPLAWLPRPDVTTPSIQIASLIAAPIYSPTVSLIITVPRAELDLNRIHVQLHDRATGALLDDQVADFNLHLPAGMTDTLNTAGIQLVPAHFNTTTTEYTLTANFNALRGFDAFTLTAEASDLAGHIGRVTTTVDDTLPPATVNTLTARRLITGAIKLSWLAPGDSDWVGRAATYDIRYTHQLIGGIFAWSSATALSAPPTPITGGLLQQWIITTALDNPVYFALKAADVEGNWSQRSNVTTALAQIYLPVILKL